jgi:hypothetical protein
MMCLFRYGSIAPAASASIDGHRHYDVPWNQQNEAYGKLIGSKFGKVLEVNVDKTRVDLEDYR